MKAKRKVWEATPQIIAKMVRRLARRFTPERIILFGSHARGEAGPDSDVDLLVIMPFAGSRRQTEIELRLALHDFVVPVDVVLASPEEVDRRRHIAGTLLRPALQEGKVMYVRA